MSKTKNDSAAASTYYVLDRLHHDGVAYEPDDRITAIDSETAERLCALGVLSRVAPIADPEPEPLA